MCVEHALAKAGLLDDHVGAGCDDRDGQVARDIQIACVETSRRADLGCFVVMLERAAQRSYQTA